MLLYCLQVPPTKCYTRIAFGQHGVIAASYDRCLHFLDQHGNVQQAIVDAHEAAITCLQWRPTLVTLSTSSSSSLSMHSKSGPVCAR